MAKSRDDEHEIVRGFFTPHTPVNWTGEILDVKTGELVKEPSMTKQSFVAECDINNIVRDFMPADMALMMVANMTQGQFVDLPDQMDFQQGLEIVQKGSEAFSALPARLRRRFDNNPAEFLEFMANPANAEEIVKLGLANPPPIEPAPVKVELVGSTPPPPLPPGG